MTSTPRRRRWIWLCALLLLVAVGAGIAKSRSGGGPPIDPALVVEVKRGDLAIEVIEIGKVQPRERIEVKSKVAGQVARVLVDEGASVRKGQLLLELEPNDFQRDVARAEADVAQAQNAIEFANLNLERRRRGVENRGVPQVDLDFALNEVKVKTVALRTANVALAAARDRLRYTQLLAPIDGTVIERNIRPGEVVTPGVQATFEGRPLLTVADLSTLVVKTDLNQIDVAKVKLGQRVTLTLDALPGRTYEGSITKVAPASVLPKGKDIEVFPVEATLDRSDGAIKPGMSADVRIHIDTRSGVLSLPIEAVVKESGKSYVTKVLTDEKGRQRTDRIEVTVGARNDHAIEITGGIGAADRILIKPASSSENEAKL